MNKQISLIIINDPFQTHTTLAGEIILILVGNMDPWPMNLKGLLFLTPIYHHLRDPLKTPYKLLCKDRLNNSEYNVINSRP